MPFKFTNDHLRLIRKQPHLIGKLSNKNKLTELHSQWIIYIWDSLEHRGLQGHRGSYKTTAISVIGAIWWLLFHRNDRIAIVRKSFTDASDIVKTISEIMKLPEIIALFHYAHGIIPKAVVDRDSKLIFNFKDTKTPEGSIDAYGIDTGITGRHYDKILMDDVVTLKDRISKAEREKTKEVLMEIIANIIDPGKQVMHIGTPWQKHDAWELDAIKEIKKYNVHQTNILNLEEIEEKKRCTSKLLFSINYELEHKSDDEAIFADPIYGNWDHNIRRVVGHIDAKYDGNKDTNALTFMARKNNQRIQAVGFTFTENVKEKYEFIKNKYQQYRCTKMYCEKNADKGYLADKLEDMGLNFEPPYFEGMNKHLKIITHLGDQWDNIDWDENTDDEYMEQLIDYREGAEPDDSPDSASSLICRGFNKDGRIYNLYT